MFKLKSCGLHISFVWPYMLTLYFCLEGELPVLRTWSSVPRIGDTIALPELGGNVKPLMVYDVVWEGSEVPSVSVFVHHAKTEHPLRTDPTQSFVVTETGAHTCSSAARRGSQLVHGLSCNRIERFATCPVCGKYEFRDNRAPKPGEVD